MKLTLTAVMLLALASSSASALEASASGSQTNQANVNVLNSKIDALQAQLQAAINCSVARKFYSPADPKKDANGCVGTGDYDLNMASTSNINLANGRVYGTNTATNNWGGLFYGPDNYGGVYGNAGIYGVYGNATGNGYGVIGNATANSGGVGGSFYGGNSGARGSGNAYGLLGSSTSGYGVFGTSSSGNGVYGTSSSNWSIEGVGGPYGVYGYGSSYGVYGASGGWAGYFAGNVNVSGQLCLNGDCTTSIPALGAYTYPSSGPSAYSLWTGPYSFVCPGNKVVVGLQVSTAGTCSNKCNGDGPIIRNIQLICR